MARRIHKSFTDYMVLAVTPALLIVMIASLAFYLIACFYGGAHDLRLKFIAFMFVMGSVLITRIAIEEGKEYASLFAFPLGGAVFLAAQKFVQLGVVLNLALIAIIWWSAHKLTWDSTLIDDDEGSTGEGLLETLQSDRQEAEATTQRSDAEVEKQEVEVEEPLWKQWLTPKKRPHNPGKWVIYFALGSLPLLAIGNLNVAEHNRGAAFGALALYVAAALAVLLATSFLGLRKYLRQRRLEMPLEMAGVWLACGLIMIGLVMLCCLVLPRPGVVIGSETTLWQFGSTPLEQASNNGQGSDAADSDQGRAGKTDDQSQSTGSGKGQQNKKGSKSGGGKKQGGGSKENSESGKSGAKGGDLKEGSPSKQSGSGNSKQGKQGDSSSQSASQKSGNTGKSNDGQKSGGDSKSQQPSGGNDKGKSDSGKSGDNGKKQGDSKQGQSSDSNGGQDGSKGDSGDSQNNEQGTKQNGKQNGKQNEPQKGQKDGKRKADNQNSESSSNGRPFSQRSSPDSDAKDNDSKESSKRNRSSSSNNWTQTIRRLPGLGLRAIYWIGLILLVGYLLVRYRDEVAKAWRQFVEDIKRLWARLFGGSLRETADADEETAATAAAATPETRFADFANPFVGDAWRQQTAESLVRYSFAATEAWARERGCPRGAEQTPNEFARALAASCPELAPHSAALGQLYTYAAYAPRELPAENVEHLRKLWEKLNATDPSAPTPPPAPPAPPVAAG